MSDLYRLIYTSRDRIGGTAEEHRLEVGRILDGSRSNNGRDGITGALLSAAGTFVQILEGPRAAVEATFERIRRDARHGDIDVLQGESVSARTFTGWGMAFVPQIGEDRDPCEDLSRRVPLDPARFEADGLCAAVLSLVRAQDGASAADAQAVPRPFDAGRLRAELAARLSAGRTAVRPGEAAAPPPDAPPDAGDAVLRAALDEERARTTELRRELDGARVAFARAQAGAEAVERQRDIWADRSVQLRSNLREAREKLAGAEAERDALRGQRSSQDADLDRMRVHRDIWAERARALAAALCREPAEVGRSSGEGRGDLPLPGRERPSLRTATN